MGRRAAAVRRLRLLQCIIIYRSVFALCRARSAADGHGAAPPAASELSADCPRHSQAARYASTCRASDNASLRGDPTTTRVGGSAGGSAPGRATAGVAWETRRRAARGGAPARRRGKNKPLMWTRSAAPCRSGGAPPSAGAAGWSGENATARASLITAARMTSRSRNCRCTAPLRRRAKRRATCGALACGACGALKILFLFFFFFSFRDRVRQKRWPSEARLRDMG